jgi:hypothetical protein
LGVDVEISGRFDVDSTVYLINAAVNQRLIGEILSSFRISEKKNLSSSIGNKNFRPAYLHLARNKPHSWGMNVAHLLLSRFIEG